MLYYEINRFDVIMLVTLLFCANFEISPIYPSQEEKIIFLIDNLVRFLTFSLSAEQKDVRKKHTSKRRTRPRLSFYIAHPFSLHLLIISALTPLIQL